MHSRAERQAAFGHALLGGADAALLAEFAGSAANAGHRFAAYRRNVLGNWRGALAATYPVLAAQLGEARFRTVCDAYAARHPSVDGDLNAFGGALPIFLQVVDAAAEYPWLPDLARLEWALQHAYAAADATPPDLSRLAALPPARQGAVRLRLWPGATLLTSDWPVAAIWRAHRLPEAGRDAALAALDLAPRTRAALATRDARGEPSVLDFSPGEATLWAVCAPGASLADAVGAAAAAEPACDPPVILARWLASGLIVAVE